jgi:predicted permease
MDVLAPILLMVGVGAVMRWKFAIDMGTLTKLNLYLFSPAFIFEKVATSSLPWADMGGIFIVSSVSILSLGAMIIVGGLLLGKQRSTATQVALLVMFYNAGNYGIPLAELAFPAESGRDGGASQAFVIMAMNLLTFTVGSALASMSQANTKVNWRTITRDVFRIPAIPALGAALVCRYLFDPAGGWEKPAIIFDTARYLSAGLVPVALVTLGAQLAVSPRWPRWKPVSAILFLRLIYGPIHMAGLLWLFHLTGVPVLNLWPWPAAVMILTAAAPVAVNTLLLTIEMGGNARLAADSVFWTTLISAITVLGWLVLIRAAMG